MSTKHAIIKLRRGTAAEWSASLPQPGGEVLSLGEPGYEKDTGRLKIGDGTTPWNSLPYFNDGAPIDPEVIQDLLGDGFLVAGSGINIIYNDLANILTISTSGVAVSGHTHVSTDITDFNSAVSGLLVGYATLNNPNFTGIPTAPTATSGTNSDQIATTSFVRTEIVNLIDSAPSTLDTLNELAAALGDDPNFATTITNSLSNKADLSGATFTGSVIIPSGNANFNTLTVNGTSVSLNGHTHTSSEITDFNSSVSGLLPVKNITAGMNIQVSSIDGNFTVAATGLQPSGNYSVVGHSHTSSDITNFSSSVSGLLPVKNITSGSNIQVTSIDGNFTVSATGLQPSGNYSVVGHTHIASDITNFNSAVSGLLPTINNYADNRILTSTGTSTGINAENNLTFNGTNLVVAGDATIDNLKLDGNTISSISGNIIISPSGSGALQRDINGDARGEYAIDLQGDRENTTQVASGKYSVIAGGSSHTASGYHSSVGGGRNNTANGSYSAVAGGYQNTAAGTHSAIGGGIANTTNGNSNTIAGGYQNTASFDHSTVCGGFNNNAINYYSVVAGGLNNTSSGYNSNVGGGFNNTSSGYNSNIGGGANNSSSGSYSIVPGGYSGIASRYGELSHAAGQFSSIGDAQHTVLVARQETIDDSPDVELFLDGSSEKLIIADKTSWTFSIKISAYNCTDDEAGWWILRGGIRRSTAGTSLVGSIITETDCEGSLSSASVSIVADNDALEIKVTGVSGKTIRWVAVTDICQVSCGNP